MSLKVIELNDGAVTVSDENGLLMQSPGFATIGDRGLLIGRTAEQQARLRPTSSFNKFWHQLSMEPLTYSVGKVRHHADLAYAHLLHLAEEASLEDEVIFAVPGNFTSQQLSVLLGLSRQCPFKPVGIVDAALASAIKLVDSPTLVFADIQLHQALLTRFSVVDGQLRRDTVVQIPDAGLQQFTNLVMQLATGMFIQQCRFNPQHNAESEQLLYNALPEWLASYGPEQNNLHLEIKTPQAVHHAKLPMDTLQQRLADFHRRIHQQIGTLVQGTDSQVAISARLAELPFFRQSLDSFGEVRVAQPASLGMTCIRLREHIDSSQDGFRLVTSLPLAREISIGSTSERRQAADSGGGPTHLLYESIALPLGKITINNEPATNQGRVNGKSIHLPVAGLPLYLGQIEREGNDVFIICGEAGAMINGEPVTGRKKLALGDLVRFSDDSEGIRLIRVRDGVG